MMYNAVAVEYTVKETTEKKKARGHRRKNKDNESNIKYTRPSTAEGVRPLGSSDPSTTTNNNINKRIPHKGGADPALPIGAPPSRPSSNTRPKSPGSPAVVGKTSRPSTAGSDRRKSHDGPVHSSIYPHQQDWVNPWGVPDLDKLQRDKIMTLAGRRSKYDHEDSRRESNPNLVLGESRLAQKKDKSVHTRERYYPHTVGTIANNELPFYPFLKEQTQTTGTGTGTGAGTGAGFVVSERWNRMTIPEDDPPRARPENRADKKKDRNSFHHIYDKQQLTRIDDICVTNNLSAYPSLASKF